MSYNARAVLSQITILVATEEILPEATFIEKFFDSKTGFYPFLRMVAILLLTHAIVIVYRQVAKRLRKKHNKVQHRFLQNFILVIIYVTGIFWAFRQLESLSEPFLAVLAGSGILALAISLAAQESLANAVNGIFITIFKPFEIGDRVHLINGKITGTVEDITLRHTIIKTYSNSRIIIPNTTINKDMIENSNFQNNRVSAFIDVTIPYDSDIKKAQKIMARLVENHPLYVPSASEDRPEKGLASPEVPVFVRELTLQGPVLRASMWCRNISDSFQACSDVRVQLVKEFAKQDIRISTNIAPAPPNEPSTSSEESEKERKRKEEEKAKERN